MIFVCIYVYIREAKVTGLHKTRTGFQELVLKEKNY